MEGNHKPAFQRPLSPLPAAPSQFPEHWVFPYTWEPFLTEPCLIHTPPFLPSLSHPREKAAVPSTLFLLPHPPNSKVPGAIPLTLDINQRNAENGDCGCSLCLPFLELSCPSLCRAQDSLCLCSLDKPSHYLQLLPPQNSDSGKYD